MNNYVKNLVSLHMSPLVRGEWIEILRHLAQMNAYMSPLVRGEWIEILKIPVPIFLVFVSPRERGVD